jgi:DNA mismatch repair ATPase MutS
MQQMTPDLSYRQELDKLTDCEKKLLKRKTLLSIQRFLFILLSFFTLWQLWNISIIAAFAGFLIFLGLFIFAVLRDLKNKEAIDNTRLLMKICQQELEILHHQFTDLPDGKELEPPHHEYAGDLDILGKSSLYQYINRTTSQQGNQRMADWLLRPADVKTILQRQEASTELSTQPEWIHQFRAHGITQPVTSASENKVSEWLQENDQLPGLLWLKVLRIIFPFITAASLALFVFNFISGSIFTFLLIAFFGIASGISRFIQPRYNRLNKIVPELETLENSIRMIEKKSFKSKLLQQSKNDLGAASFAASGSIKKLKKILARLDYRYNPLIYIPLNTFFLWDLQQIFVLMKWKENHHQQIPLWFHVLPETEALISLATLRFNHPDWCYPEFSTDKFVFTAIELGHPLIPKSKRIVNSFSTKGEKQINLVTGSNMAGKSTFLRSVGVNIVLAMMGAPVCCKDVTLSAMKVMSSMRVNDNLEENTSTFYAELKKLKEIIEAVKRQENVLILLDEILRGTNSADRHTGSIALLKQLLRENASCIVATHDLELAAVADEYPGNVHNFHFDVQVQNEELYFDYKIKESICRSMNASLLMKKIGIEL